MREVVFRVLAERPGHLEAQAESLPIRITAPTLEELQHEAREALIEHLGPAHCTVRVRVRRGPRCCRQQHPVRWAALQLSVAELLRWVLSPLHEPLLPPVKTGVVHAAGLAGTGRRAHRGCNGIRRLH